VRIAHGADEARRTVLRRTPAAAELPTAARETIQRIFGAELAVSDVVERIMREVREGGDAAVRRYNQEFDGVSVELPLEVAADETKAAYGRVPKGLVEALKEAAGQVRGFHKKQMEHALHSFQKDGVGQTVRPISRVGMYVPGTAAVYPPRCR
jgi:histidinol dehydrogenase